VSRELCVDECAYLSGQVASIVTCRALSSDGESISIRISNYNMYWKAKLSDLKRFNHELVVVHCVVRASLGHGR
jgi:hypothetical protein